MMSNVPGSRVCGVSQILDNCHEQVAQNEPKLVQLDYYSLKILLQFCIADRLIASV